MPYPDPSSQTVLVVGAGGGGIGTAISRALAEIGAHLIAVDQEQSRLDVLAKELSGCSGRIETALADGTDPDSVSALFERIGDQNLPLTGLVNVVGGLPAERWRPLVDDDDENLDALLDTNLRVAIRTSREFARLHIARNTRLARDSAPPASASIVQIATIAALEAMPFGAGYAASKAALLSYSRTMALEWGHAGIRVNAVAPGSILVPKNEKQSNPERDRRVLPLGRRGTPEDVASAALFLLGEASAWVTGQVLAVDGGASIKPSYLDEDGLPVFVQDAKLRSRLLP